jgi:uncharacterized protein YebE (UPF0316 family)
MGFFESPTFTYLLLPLMIFIARIADVSIGTMRIIFTSRGAKVIAPLLGFFEVLIWLLAMGRVMQNLNNVACYLAYGAGFAAGNYVGICIEQKLAMGTFIIRVVTAKDASELIAHLRAEGYGATSIAAHGGSGPVSVIYSVVKRGHIREVIQIIRKFNPNAFYSIEDVRFVSEGIFPSSEPFYLKGFRLLPRILRKGK